MLFFGIIVALLFSALFSGSEIAYISASRLIVELRKKRGSRKGKIISNFMDKPAQFLSTMLVGNNIALVILTILLTSVITPVLTHVVTAEFPLALLTTLIITLIVLIFGEFLPKTLFRLYANQILFALAPFLNLLKSILAFPTWIMYGASQFFLKFLFKIEEEETEDAFTRLDLENLIRSSNSGENEEEIDTELFEKALHLRDVRVKECMVPRTEIAYIDVADGMPDLLEKFEETSLSRIIIVQNDIDNILGYIHHQSLLQPKRKFNDLIMKIQVVPEVMRVRETLNLFIKNRLSIACIVDEYGGTAGIITLEDILEEIFGEIEDEHDSEDLIEVELVENKSYRFAGRLEVDYLNQKYPYLNFPEGDYSTLSGYLVTSAGTIPEQGEEMELGTYRFVVETVSDTKIETIRVEVVDGYDENANS